MASMGFIAKLTPRPRMTAVAPLAVLWIAGICILVEMSLLAADLRLAGSPLWRGLAYQYAAFWPGLLYGWQPNYSLQPVAMFFTYAFLHVGLGHLAGNMLSLLVLGRIVVQRVGEGGFLLLYSVSMLGGAAFLGAMPVSSQHTVGASGALFGLAGAWHFWNCYDAKTRSEKLWRLAGGVGFLVLLNAVFWVLLGGTLAWQAHLGGFLAGWIAAAALRLCRFETSN